MPHSIKYKTSSNSIFVRFPGNFIVKSVAEFSTFRIISYFRPICTCSLFIYSQLQSITNNIMSTFSYCLQNLHADSSKFDVIVINLRPCLLFKASRLFDNHLRALHAVFDKFESVVNVSLDKIQNFFEFEICSPFRKFFIKNSFTGALQALTLLVAILDFILQQ